MNNSDMPAMPILGDTDGFVEFLEGCKGGRNYGLTKREHFAAMALMGLLSNQSSHVSFWAQEDGSLAKVAVNHADSLLVELEKGNE